MISNIKEISLEFKELGKCLQTKDLEIFALNQFKAEIGERIFGKSKAVDGSSFGSYRSESYKKKRKDEKLKVDIKNLQFSGELIKDFDLGTYNGNNALGFKTERSDTIVRGQEESPKQINKAIFSANQEEVDIVFEAIDGEVDKIIAECLKA
jgi:hypothetical protein